MVYRDAIWKPSLSPAEAARASLWRRIGAVLRGVDAKWRTRARLRAADGPWCVQHPDGSVTSHATEAEAEAAIPMWDGGRVVRRGGAE